MDVDDDLLSAVIDASRALVAIATASIAAAEVEVTLAQFRALVVLRSAGPGNMTDLSRATSLSPSSTTRLVERLERKGLVQRRPSPESRRSIEVVLTDLGTSVVDGVMAVRKQRVREVLEAVPASRRSALQRGFEEFARAAAGVPDTPFVEGTTVNA